MSVCLSYAYSVRTLAVLVFWGAYLQKCAKLCLDNPDLDSSFFKIFVLHFFATCLDLEESFPPCLLFSCMKEDSIIYIHHGVELRETKEVVSVIQILIIALFCEVIR